MLGLLDWILKNISQGYCLECGNDVWSPFNCERCHNCSLKVNVSERF